MIAEIPMQLEILPSGTSEITGNEVQGKLTLADNPCLPRILADTFGWREITFRYTDDAGRISHFGACRNGNKIVMLPHFSYGPSAERGTATEIMKALGNKGYSCEWRLTEKASDFVFTDKVTTLLDLEPDSALQYKLFNSNLRRKIRKCALNGISIKKGKSELIPDFYQVYSRNMHRLGSPALPRRWFINLLGQYRNGEALVWCAYLDNIPIGAAFVLEYRGFSEACWVSTSRKHNKYYTSYGLYWALIKHAIDNNNHQFSFGRSTVGGGVHTYKQQWGGRDLPLVWNHSHQQGKGIRRFTILTKLWKLLPYPVAKLIGPLVADRFY